MLKISAIVKNKTIVKSIKLSLVSLFANALGFLIPLYIAYEFGVSGETDNFFFSYGIIIFASTIFSGAVKSVIVPFLKRYLHNQNEFDVFVSSTVYYAMITSAAICIFVSLILICLINVFHSSFYLYLLISIPIMFFTVLNSLGYGILNSLDKFYLAEFSPFTRALIIYISIYFLNPYLGISSIIVGYNLGELGKFIHLYYIIKYRNKVNISFKLRDYSIIKDFVKIGSYQAVSTSISSASPLIDKVVAAFLAIGSLSILDYGNRLFMVFNVLLNSFLVVILSKWSQDVISKKLSLRKINLTIFSVFLMTLFIFGLIYLLKEGVVSLLYPTLSEHDQNLIQIILVLNMAAFVFSASNQIVNRATIAINATSILVKTSIVKSVANVILDVLLVIWFGVVGIAISSVFVNFIGLVVNYRLFVTKARYNGLSI